MILEHLGPTMVKAVHKFSGKDVVIKVISKEESTDQLAELALENMTSSLKLEALTMMYEYIEDADFTYIIRPYCNIGNLR